MAAIDTTTAQTPSMADLRAMANRTAPAEKQVATETPDSEVETEEESTEAESGTAHERQQEQEEFELPAGVQKRIAAEAKKAAFFQSKIDKAVSERKAREAEAAKLSGNPGSEPDKTTAPDKSRPKRPDLSTFGGSFAEYSKALDEYEGKFEEWLKAESRKAVTEELTVAQAKDQRKKAWEAADSEFSKAGDIKAGEFSSLMDSLRDSTPPGMQVAISALDDWARVALHLAKNESERDAMVELFTANPNRATAELGKLEDRLKPAAKASEPEKETSTRRPARSVAGGATGGAQRIDLDKAPMSQFKAEVRRMRGDK